MAGVEINTEKVLELVESLPVEGKREVMMALAAQLGRDFRMSVAEQRMRHLVADRDLDWDTMTEEAKEAFADDLIHEDRSCQQ